LTVTVCYLFLITLSPWFWIKSFLFLFIHSIIINLNKLLNKTIMTKQEAINYLSTSKNVEDWNNKREELKTKISQDDLNNIDASGLIVKVLKK
jgi:hypothetical protein